MLVLPLCGISQLPEGNSNSPLTVTLIAFCIREICMSRAATSEPICCCSCWYCASSSAFLRIDSSYFCCDTQPVISSVAPTTHSAGNFMVDVSYRQGRAKAGLVRRKTARPAVRQGQDRICAEE